MKKERIQEFAARVTQGSKTDLIVIMYDIILEDIAEARRIGASGSTEAAGADAGKRRAYGSLSFSSTVNSSGFEVSSFAITPSSVVK